MDRFKIRGQVSSGAHGVIYKAVKKGAVIFPRSDVPPDQFLAIKRIFVKGNNLPLQLLREIKTLQLLNSHVNIIELLDVFTQDSSANLVFPFLPVTLSHLIHEESLSTYQKLAYCFMMCHGIDYIHGKGIIHRDIKPANLLIDWNGVLKICDFGQARLLPSSEEHTEYQLSHQVCTRWYRAPELLYGSTSYDGSVDIWSAGCSIAEIYIGDFLFPGESDIEQLFLVISSLGPTDPDWAAPLPDYNKITFNISEDEVQKKSEEWRESVISRVKNADVADLIFKTCRYTDRLTSTELLNHTSFKSIRENGLEESLLFKPTLNRELS